MKKKLMIIIPTAILAVALICGGVVFAATYGESASGSPSDSVIETAGESTDTPDGLTLVVSETLSSGEFVEYYVDDNGGSYMYVDGKLRSRSGLSQNDEKTLPYANGKLTRDQAFSNAMLFFADKEGFNEFSLCYESEYNGKYTFDFRRTVKGFPTKGSYSVTIGPDGQVSKWSDYGVEDRDIYDNIDESLLEGVTKEVLIAYCEEQTDMEILDFDIVTLGKNNDGGYYIECGCITDSPFGSPVVTYPLG